MPGRLALLPAILFFPTLYALLYAAGLVIAGLLVFPARIRRWPARRL